MQTRGAPAQVFSSTLILMVIVYLVLALMAYSAVSLQSPGLLGLDKSLTDYDAFYVAGLISGEGNAGLGYHEEYLRPYQAEYASGSSFMPWTYLPIVTLTMQGFASIPIGFSYVAYMAIGMVACFWVLRRLAGSFLPGIFILMFPVIALNVKTGQNGFYTGALVGIFLLAYWRERKGAGLPLGLMIIKPHLAVAISLLTLLGWRVWTAVIAALVVAAALVLPTIVYGTGIWADFLNAVRESSAFLNKGAYPLERMTSVYAFLKSFHVISPVAISIHTIVAIAAMGAVVWAWAKKQPFNQLAALVCAASIMVSPYNYDYDLVILAIGFSFVVADFVARSSGVERLVFGLLVWLATSFGTAAQIADMPRYGYWHLNYSIAAPILIGLMIWTAIILKRQISIDEASLA